MLRLRLAAPLLAGLAAACMAPVTPLPPHPAPPPAPPPPVSVAGLDRVMGQDAAGLIALIGPPALDAREGPARRLQFRGTACVLDAYLYPPAGALGPLRVTWIDTRTPVGGEIDRASCIAALARR